MPGRPHNKLDTVERVLAKVNIVNGCWMWKGQISRYGYAHSGGKGVHRIVYKRLRGSIPQDLVLDHLCRNRSCINPDHLEPVTNAENMRRGKQAQQTHCIHGHEFTPENTRRWNGLRGCKTCCHLTDLNRSAGRKITLKGLLKLGSLPAGPLELESFQ